MNTYKIIQTNTYSMGQVAAYCDSFILNKKSIVFLSIYGTTVAVKSLTAQIVSNRGGIFVKDGNDEFLKIDGQLLELKRHSETLRIVTKNLKPSITQKVIYSNNLFFPEKKDQPEVFIFGKTEEDAINRFMGILDQSTTIPLKRSWKYWLWEQLEDQQQEPMIHASCEDFGYCRILNLPSEDWLQESITKNLEYLRTI